MSLIADGPMRSGHAPGGTRDSPVLPVPARRRVPARRLHLRPAAVPGAARTGVRRRRGAAARGDPPRRPRLAHHDPACAGLRRAGGGRRDAVAVQSRLRARAPARPRVRPGPRHRRPVDAVRAHPAHGVEHERADRAGRGVDHPAYRALAAHLRADRRRRPGVDRGGRHLRGVLQPRPLHGLAQPARHRRGDRRGAGRRRVPAPVALPAAHRLGDTRTVPLAGPRRDPRRRRSVLRRHGAARLAGRGAADRRPRRRRHGRAALVAPARLERPAPPRRRRGWTADLRLAQLPEPAAVGRPGRADPDQSRVLRGAGGAATGPGDPAGAPCNVDRRGLRSRRGTGGDRSRGGRPGSVGVRAVAGRRAGPRGPQAVGPPTPGAGCGSWPPRAGAWAFRRDRGGLRSRRRVRWAAWRARAATVV
jgi:hypothetical protein